MHTTENTNAVVKIGRRYVCHLPFFEIQDLSLFSTNHVALHTKTITQKWHTINIQYKQNQIGQTIIKCLFNSLDFLRIR
jgi:hypothetical protein